MTDRICVKVRKCGDRSYWTMYYVDPVTENRVSRSTRRLDKREAERQAAKWEAELQEGRYQLENRITWEAFRERYETENLASLAPRTREAAATAMNHLERIVAPKRLASVNSDTVSRFQSELRAGGMIDTTIAGYLRHLRAALSWAVKMKMRSDVPEMHKPKRARGKSLMRGRPITAEEFDRMIEAVPKLRPKDVDAWRYYLGGLWLSGLRLEESTVLSWDPDAAFIVDLAGRHPRFRIYAEAEKGHQDRLLPITPDFVELLFQTPEAQREGPVFKLLGVDSHKPIGFRRVGRIVSAIGRQANVVVNKAAGKFASAHDLRRAFGTRWAKRVRPAILQRLMRHASINTTMDYYVALDTDDLAGELWREHGPSHTFGHSRANATPHCDQGASGTMSKPLGE